MEGELNVKAIHYYYYYYYKFENSKVTLLLKIKTHAFFFKHDSLSTHFNQNKRQVEVDYHCALEQTQTNSFQVFACEKQEARSK
jgi:hypothetical protein